MTAAERTFRALGLTFAVDGTADELVATVHEMFKPLRVPLSTPPNGIRFSLDHASKGRVRLLVSEPSNSEGRLVRAGNSGQVVEVLLAELTRRTISASPGALHLHAAAFVLDDAVVVLSGRSGSGKSTLCAAAVHDGALYLTDEVLAIGGGGDVTDALARPIRLDELPRPNVGLNVDSYQMIGGTVLVPFRTSWTAGGPLPSPRLVVALDEVAGPVRTVTPSRSEALAHVMRNSFLPAARSQSGLEAGREFVAGSAVMSLTGGTVSDRLDAIRQRLISVRREGRSRSQPPGG